MKKETIAIPFKEQEKPDGFQILLAVDQLGNALLGGWADETLSSRAYRMQHSGKFWKFTRKAIDTLFFFQKDHCHEAYLSELHRKHMPPDLREDELKEEVKEV